MSRPRLDVMNVLEQWEPDRKKGLAANAANLLDFAARKKPKEPISWSWVTKCVVGGKMHHPDSKIVVDMRARCSAIRRFLGRDYNRGLVSVRGLGVRATTDSDDYANTQLRKDATTYETARQRLVTSRARVDTKTMKNKELKAWAEDVSKVLTAHNDRLARLLLPPGEEGKEDEEGKR
jgi:hypothetical protein